MNIWKLKYKALLYVKENKIPIEDINKAKKIAEVVVHIKDTSNLSLDDALHVTLRILRERDKGNN